MARNGPARSTTITGVTTATSGSTKNTGTINAIAAATSIPCTTNQATASAGNRRNDAPRASPVVGTRSAYQPATSTATAPLTTASSSPVTANKITLVALMSV